jgi:hypothetical protein
MTGPRKVAQAGKAMSTPGDCVPGDQSVTPEEPRPAGGRAAHPNSSPKAQACSVR